MVSNAVWYDLHCHVLPGIDDGCKTSVESVQILRESKKQGIGGIIATPHYYPRESVGEFLERRNRSVQQLERQMQAELDEPPRICYGAEVAYHAGLVYEEDLNLLCLGQSCYLLLELPFSQWPSAILRDIHTLSGLGITPIIAHIERYLKLQPTRMIQMLLDSDVLIQMNAEALLGGWKSRNARRMLYKGQIHVLGSDCHNLVSRPQNLGGTAARLAGGPLGQALEAVRQRNERIFFEAFLVREEAK